MTPSPQVSVIMPIFKPKFLVTAINSIPARTMPGFKRTAIKQKLAFLQQMPPVADGKKFRQMK